MKKNRLVFIGTYSETITLGTGEVVQSKGEGIYVFRMDPETGGLTLLYKALAEPNPSYVSLDQTKQYLYSTNELKSYKGLVSGAASAFKLDAQTGRLSLLNRRATGGTDAVHLLVNDRNTHLMVANFMSGSVCVLPLARDGSLDTPSCFLQHYGSGPNPIRQTGPHAHGFTLDKANKRAFVPDLGCDKVFVYDVDFETGHLNAAPTPFVELEKGEGPRHCVLHHNGRFLYVINEMGNSVYTFSYDPETCAMERLQISPTLPAGYGEHSTCSAIKIHPNGKILYGSNRGHDSLATYRIDDATGLLTLLSIQSTGGSTPRDFDIDPSGEFLIAANQASNNLVTFRIDPENGALTEIGRTEDVFTATCVRIYDMD